MIREWERRVDQAESHEELAEIQTEWKEKGRWYKTTEWPIYFGALAARKMILNGDNPDARPF